MTSEALDLLDRLSNPTNIKQAALERDRPQDRFPATHFKADILGKGSDLEVTTRRPQGSNFDQTGVWLSIDVKEIYAGRGELGEQQLWVRVPAQRQDGRQDANDNSELGQMMLAANANDPTITSIRNLPGRKNVEFKDDVHKFMGRQRNDQTGEWSDREFTAWFYRLNFRGGVSNGTTATAVPAKAQPTEAAINRALTMIKDAGADGIKEVEFNMAVTKGKDALPPVYVAEGTFVGDNHDKVLRDGDKLVWVAAD